jgi:hypothetical protein
MGDHEKALEMVKKWKKAGSMAERFTIMKYETQITSQIIKSQNPDDTIGEPQPIDDSSDSEGLESKRSKPESESIR